MLDLHGEFPELVITKILHCVVLIALMSSFLIYAYDDDSYFHHDDDSGVSEYVFKSLSTA